VIPNKDGTEQGIKVAFRLAIHLSIELPFLGYISTSTMSTFVEKETATVDAIPFE
jgi:hypothetical protein